MKQGWQLLGVAFAVACYAGSASAKRVEFDLDDHAPVAVEVMQPGEVDHNIMPGMTDGGEDDVVAVPHAPEQEASATATAAPVMQVEVGEPAKPVREPKKSATKPVAEKPVKKAAPKQVVQKEPEPQEIPSIETENEVSKSDDVTYVTGGIGEDEKAAIEAAKGDYNLQVMSASQNGAFVGDAKVVISQKNGKETVEMLNVVAGPLLYVRLPAGSYVLDASLGAQKKHQAFTVSRKGTPARIHLGWKVDAKVSN